MKFQYLLSLAAALAPVASNAEKSVFAHFIVGNAASMTLDQWKTDIKMAQEAHIDGFALNIAPQDSYTENVLQNAYKAAEGAGQFSLFLSFDYASGGPWKSDRVVNLINTYKNHPAQFKYNNKPLVSTFEGPNNANDWPSIKSETGCFFMPSWTSLGPGGLSKVLNIVDGFFSWDAWGEGATVKSLDSDKAWRSALGGKPYMMPISPWFYTNLPQWDKNWLWRGDDLWHDRWEQSIEFRPELIQIITWNDFGESHHIGPIHDSGIPKGAEWYVQDHAHDGWRVLLPQYIDRYKSGNLTMKRSAQPAFSNSTTNDIISYWYRQNPAGSGSTGGTTGNNPAIGQPVMEPSKLSQDKVFLSVSVMQPSDVTVQIGGSDATKLRANVAGISHFSVPFNGQTGAVRIVVSRAGSEVASVTGPEITRSCQDGKINWNAITGSNLGGKNSTA